MNENQSNEYCLKTTKQRKSYDKRRNESCVVKYIENRKALALMSEALNLASKPQSWLCEELKTCLSKIRYYRRSD